VLLGNLEIYNPYVLYMSGRSGYGRSRIVGKLIHLPANMMMAGLAPKVGKSGASIRLYWQRVAECCIDSCRADPIKILKRYLTPGKWLTPTGWNPGGVPTTTYTFGNAVGSDVFVDNGWLIADYISQAITMPHYIILFDKEIFSNNSQVPPADLNLYKCDPVGAAGATFTIPTTDYYYTTQGGGAGTALGTKEYSEVVSPLAISAWNIDISGNYNIDDVGSRRWNIINNEDASSLVGGFPTAYPNAGGWVGTSGLGVPPGKYSKETANAVFIVHKNVPTHFPGNPTAKAAMIFNISNLLVKSWNNNDTGATSLDFAPNGATPCQQLMLLVRQNGISTTYFGSGVGTGNPLHINILDECINAQAAIAPFKILSVTGLPILEQLPL